MNEYIKVLRKYVAENPPVYGSDAHSILEIYSIAGIIDKLHL